ncbi:MAG: hypothetical protein Q8L60_10360 [Gammaproteobacteria bacterium]|nr:hypothetical protein [Gammaproteobacteria bacterium]MDP2346481.1 hypothetical protein [Gammaproteobacteria bacterium]
MKSQWRDIDIRYYAIAVSLLLSFLHALLNPMPNADAYAYVRTAEVYLNDGVAAAFSWYPSATYSVLIGVLHQVTGLNLFAAGQLLNSFLYALVVYTFISLALEIRDTRRLAIIAAVTVLIYPQLNEYRYFLIRDIGFLAFALLGLLFLIRYGKAQRIADIVVFCVATAIAALFRSEALVYFMVGPLVLLFSSQLDWRARLVMLSKMVAIAIGLAFLAAVVLVILDVNVVRILRRIVSVYLPFLNDAWASLSAESSPLTDAVFGEYAADYSGKYIVLFMTAGLGAILLIKLITGFGAVPLLIILYGLKKRFCELTNPALRPVFCYALIAFVIMLGFLMLTRFMSTRYTLLFCTSLVLLIPLVIDNALLQVRGESAMKITKGVLGFIVLFCAVDAHISFGASKEMLQDASDWIVANTPENVSLITNSSYVAYHSGRVRNYDKISRYVDENTITYAGFGTLLALALDRNVNELLEAARSFQQVELVVQFPAEGEPEFAIYRRTGFLP